jgi:hypothetical protein
MSDLRDEHSATSFPAGHFEADDNAEAMADAATLAYSAFRFIVVNAVSSLAAASPPPPFATVLLDSFAAHNAAFNNLLPSVAIRAWSSKGRLRRTRSDAAKLAASAATPHAARVAALDEDDDDVDLFAEPDKAATAAAARAPASSAAVAATEAMTSRVADIAARSTARSKSGVHASSMVELECGTTVCVAAAINLFAACVAAALTDALALSTALAVTAAVASSTAASVAASTAKSTNRRKPGRFCKNAR